MIKTINRYLKVIILLITIVCCGKVEGQVNGFNLSTSATAVSPANLGVGFPVSVSMSWAPSTSSASITINFNNTQLAYDASTTNLLPCMSVAPSASSITITISNLSNCTNTGSINFPVGFKFVCPDSCTGTVKTAQITGSVTDNLGTPITPSSCIANGILVNSLTMQHNFVSYNSLTAEATYKIYYYNQNCFRIRAPSFNIALSSPLATITSINGSYYGYTLTAGNIITPNMGVIDGGIFDYIYYVVKLPCLTLDGQIFSSNVTLLGTNCGLTNSNIRGPVAATPSFVIPTTSPLSNISVSQSSTSTYFYYNITNTGNTPLNLTTTSILPLVHLTSVQQSTSQVGIVDSVKYFDCSSIGGNVYSLIGSASNSNVPTNTRRIEHSIYNLMPQQTVSLQAFYNLTSSCNVAAGSPPFKDSLHIVYNCVAPPVTCKPCGIGGIIDTAMIYNPSPIFACDSSTSMQTCKGINDTISFAYKFRNSGDAPLVGGTYTIPLPPGINAVAGSLEFTGFSTNPTVVSGSNLQFTLPNLPVGSGVYRIKFKAIIQTGAVAGTTNFYNTLVSPNYSYQYSCYTTLKICPFSAINIVKNVKGSLDVGYSLSGQGAPNTTVNYQVILFNSGTTPINNLVVIDRIPSVGNLTILGNPNTSAPVSNQFDMEMLAVPANTKYTTMYTSTQNICTLWPSTGTNCNSGVWSTSLLQKGVKFTYTPSFTILPGSTDTFYFQTKIPVGLANGLKDCNTAGFFATPIGSTLFATESAPACITVLNPCPPATPAFTTTQACVNDTIKVTATSTFTGTASHQWTLMQANTCGSTTDVATPVMIGAVQTTPNAVFNITNFGICYYIKHRIFSTTGCVFDTTFKLPVTLPTSTLSISSNLKDSTGVIKDNFCVGENVYLDGTASNGETQYTIQVLRRLAGSTGIFSNYVTLTPFTGTAGFINLTQLLLSLPTPRYFEPQYEYSVTFAISNPGTCTAPRSTKNPFKIVCCDGYINANFQLNVAAAASSYTITPVIFNSYAGANPTHEWYVLSSPNSGAGPYTPVFSTTSATFTLPNVQYNLYYSVIHKIKTKCGEDCVGREQFQTNRSTEAVFVDCCLATQYWANGAGTAPQPLSAEFAIGTTPIGSGSTQFSIETYPTFDYSNNSLVTHEWYVLSSPNTAGGPYTAVGHSTNYNYTYSPANTGLYYFIIHKVKTPCGEVCFGKSVCIDCGGSCTEKCEMCGVIDCKLLDEVWPACYPPINLVNNCRRGTLSWDVVPSANSYEVEFSYNDPSCCDSKYDQLVITHNVHLNSLNINDYVHPKFNCIRWRVRAYCERGVVGAWSDWSCYYCEEIIIFPPIEEPMFPKSQTATDINPAIKTEPKVSPNPNYGEMNLLMEAKTELVLSVEVYNSQGLLIKAVQENKYPDGKFASKLNLGNNTAKGLYLIVFKTNFGTFNKKVIIY